MSEWRQVSCGCCSGLTWHWGSECGDCGGTGALFVSDKDRLALYPGGPFRGSWPGKYDAALPNPPEPT